MQVCAADSLTHKHTFVNIFIIWYDKNTKIFMIFLADMYCDQKYEIL